MGKRGERVSIGVAAVCTLRHCRTSRGGDRSWRGDGGAKGSCLPADAPLTAPGGGRRLKVFYCGAQEGTVTAAALLCEAWKWARRLSGGEPPRGTASKGW